MKLRVARPVVGTAPVLLVPTGAAMYWGPEALPSDCAVSGAVMVNDSASRSMVVKLLMQLTLIAGAATKAEGQVPCNACTS